MQDGVADLGIVGQNVLVEAGFPDLEVEALGFSKCRLSLAVPRAAAYESIQSLQGKNIATSYPKILGRLPGRAGRAGPPAHHQRFGGNCPQHWASRGYL